MAIINFGGFEHGPMASTAPTGDVYAWSGTAARASMSTTTVKHGTRALRIEDLGGAFAGAYAELRTPARAALGWSSGTRHVYFWFRMQTEGPNDPVVVDIGTRMNVVWVTASNGLQLQGATNSTVAAVTAATWVLVHITFVVGGSCSLQINGGTAVTASAHGGTADYVRLGANGDVFEADMFFDSWVLADASLSYDPAVYRMGPDGIGNGTGWTNDWDEIEEIAQDGDTSFISTSSAATKESVTLESTSTAGVTGTIKAVKSLAIVRDEGGVSSIETYIRPGSTDTEGGENVDPGTTYAGIGAVWETNPDTSSAWTASELDATEVGVLNNNAVAVRCTTLGLMVLTDGVAGGVTVVVPAAAGTTAAGVTPTPQVIVPGAVATVTSAAVVPTPVVQIPAVAATVTSAGLLPDTVQSPPTATATSAAVAPTMQVLIPPDAATVTAAAVTPVPVISIPGAVATVTSAAVVPTPQVIIPAVVATSTSTAIAPQVNPGGDVTIAVPVATVAAAAVAPEAQVLIPGVAATVTSEAVAPVVQIIIPGTVASVSASGVLPDTVLSPPTASVSAAAVAPEPVIRIPVPDAATSTGAAVAPGISIVIPPPAATVSVLALPPAVNANQVVTPAERIFVVAAEDRVFEVSAETRTFTA